MCAYLGTMWGTVRGSHHTLGRSLYMTEKGHLEIAGKFLEGAIHELQTQYDATEKPELVGGV